MKRKLITKVIFFFKKKRQAKQGNSFAVPLRQEQQLTENYMLGEKRKEANVHKTDIWVQGKRNRSGKGPRKTAKQNGLVTNDVVKAPVLRRNLSNINVLWRMDKEEKIHIISKGSHSFLGGKQQK